jgi:L-serine dehydratase
MRKKIKFRTFKELKDQVLKSGMTLPQFLKQYEATNQDISVEEVEKRMRLRLLVMKNNIVDGLKKPNISRTGLTQGGAYKVKNFFESGGSTLLSPEFTEVIMNTLAVSETNACMGRIVAAPTAGACGVLPGALLTVAKHKNISDDKLIDALFVSGGIGEVIGNIASLSGAKHGCQAEIGSATSMAAGAIVSLFSNDIDAIESAAAFAMKNLLGLVCDPIGGYVEIPCIKRNVSGAFNAISSAEMALAGIRTVIPFDEVVLAMKRIGEKMSPTLKETAEGGLAATPTAKKIVKRIKSK